MDKAAIRQNHRSRRRQRQAAPAISPDRWHDLVAATGSFGPVTAMAAFQPMAHEPDVRPLVRAVRDAGIPIYLPRMEGSDMQWVRASAEQLQEQPTRVPSPTGAATTPPDTAGTVILIPALAIDPRTGFRLGYGAGNYDRFLRHHYSMRRVGVCFEDELCEVPAEPHDEAVQLILTPTRVRVI